MYLTNPVLYNVNNILFISASLGAMMIYGGIQRGFGILFVEFRKSLQSSSAGMSVVVSVQIAVMSFACKTHKFHHLVAIVKFKPVSDDVFIDRS